MCFNDFDEFILQLHDRFSIYWALRLISWILKRITQSRNCYYFQGFTIYCGNLNIDRLLYIYIVNSFWNIVAFITSHVFLVLVCLSKNPFIVIKGGNQIKWLSSACHKSVNVLNLWSFYLKENIQLMLVFFCSFSCSPLSEIKISKSR